MFLEKITWKQAEGYFKEKDIAIIPVGSTENHGSQLCLGTDFLIPRRLCEMMDERLNILIAPTVPFGVGDQHINFPGTITIGYDGLYDLMTRIVDQLYGFGIRKFVFLNGHGGNTPVLQRVALELDERHAMGAILNWWLLAGELDPRWKGGHGGGEFRRDHAGLHGGVQILRVDFKDLVQSRRQNDDGVGPVLCTYGIFYAL